MPAGAQNVDFIFACLAFVAGAVKALPAVERPVELDNIPLSIIAYSFPGSKGGSIYWHPAIFLVTDWEFRNSSRLLGFRSKSVRIHRLATICALSGQSTRLGGLCRQFASSNTYDF